MRTYIVHGEQTKHSHRHRHRHQYRIHRNDRQHRHMVGAATAQYRPVSVWATSATYNSLLMMCHRCTVDRNTVDAAVCDGTVDIHTHIHRLNPNERGHSSHTYIPQHEWVVNGTTRQYTYTMHVNSVHRVCRHNTTTRSVEQSCVASSTSVSIVGHSITGGRARTIVRPQIFELEHVFDIAYSSSTTCSSANGRAR